MQGRACQPLELPAVIGAAVIFAPRGLGRVLVKILRRDVVVLAGDGAAQTREVGLGLIGAGVAIRIHLGMVDPAGLKDGV